MQRSTARPARAMVPRPPAGEPPSPSHLTGEQVEFFDANGYLVLRQWVGGELLARLQAAGQTWIERGLRAGRDDADYEDYVFAKRPTGRVMFRVSYLHDKGEPASLELLGSPAVL